MTRLRRIFLLPTILAGPVCAQDVPEEMVERSVAAESDAMELARHLFPPERMASIDSARLRPTTFIRSGYRLWLHEQPELTPAGVCERRQFQYDVDEPTPYPATSLELLAASNERESLSLAIPGPDGCAGVRSYVPALEGVALELQQENMRWLADVVDQARRGERPSVRITCRTDEEGRCEDHLQALSSLPLDRLRIFSVTGPGRADNSASGLTRRVSTPVEDRAQANRVVVFFEYDGTRTAAWQIFWTVQNGEVAALHLQRTSVTYH